MDGHAEPAAVKAQRAAIQEARSRYERGELTYDAFRRALDAIVLARNTDECQAILAALPTAPLATLSALEASPPMAAAAAPRERQRITAFMSQVKKIRRPWKLEANARALALMGEIKLDLCLAELPPHATLRVTAFMGTIIIYVPRSVRVAVRSRVIMGAVVALGETVNGVIASGHDEHAPPPGTTPPLLDIEVACYMGNVRVVLTDGAAPISISELVRNALRAIATEAARGLREGARQYSALPARETRRNELPGDR